MPEKNISSLCIVCGRPSKTVVCMSCFLNYDHRAYKSKERNEDEMFYSTPEFHFEHEKEDYSVLDTEFDELDLDFVEETEREQKPRFSWLSRFPGFS